MVFSVLSLPLRKNMQELQVQQQRNQENSRVPRKQRHSHKMWRIYVNSSLPLATILTKAYHSLKRIENGVYAKLKTDMERKEKTLLRKSG